MEKQVLLRNRNLFTFLETALWADAPDDGSWRGKTPLDFDLPSIELISECLEEWATKYADLLVVWEEYVTRPGEPPSWPYYLYLTANGHGVGFWSEDHLPNGVADALTVAAKDFGSTDIIPLRSGELEITTLFK